MPKLDGTHITERLQKRLDQLHSGKEVARRDIESLLSKEQVAAWDAAWELQKQLRKTKRARTKEKEISFGWKSKREVTIEVVKAALDAAENNLGLEYENLQYKAEVRRSRIFLDSYFSAIDEGRDKESAWLLANNDLTRAGLARLDGNPVTATGLNRRDMSIANTEEDIQRQLVAAMPDEQRRVWEEQMTMLDEMKSSRKKGKGV